MFLSVVSDSAASVSYQAGQGPQASPNIRHCNSSPSKISSPSAPVTASGVGKDLHIHSSYKDIQVERVQGSLTIDGSSSPVTARHIRGDADIHTSYKEIIVDDAGGSVTIDGSSCPVSLSNIGGNAEVNSSYKDISVNQVKGFLIEVLGFLIIPYQSKYID